MSNEMVTIDQLTEILNVSPNNTYALVNENEVTKKIKLENLINKTLDIIAVLKTNDRKVTPRLSTVLVKSSYKL